MRTTGQRRTSAPASKRIALFLRQRRRAAELRDFVDRQGWQVVAEFHDTDPSVDGLQRMLDEVAAGRLSVDMVVVPSLAEVFDSALQTAEALKRLQALRIDFRSLADPVVDTTRYSDDQLARLADAFAQLDRGTASGGADRLLAGLAPGLGAKLTRLVDLQIEALTRQQQEAAESERRSTVRASIGQVLTYGLIVGGYALAVAAVSSRSPLTAVINGDRIVAALSQAGRDFVAGITVIPDPLRATVIALLASGALFIVRSYPLSARVGVVGVVFAALVNLVVLALATAMSIWFLGTLAAVIGMVALTYVVYDFCAMVITIEDLSVPRHPAPHRRPGAARLDAAIGRLELFFVRIHPGGRRLGTAVFIGLPVLCVVGVLTAITWPWLRTGFLALGFLVWAVWGVGVTRPALRIPLWSILTWTLVLVFFLYGNLDISIWFLVLAVALLVVTTTIAIFRWPIPEISAAG